MRRQEEPSAGTASVAPTSAQLGDREALGVLLSGQARWLQAVIGRSVPWSDIEDVAQEALLAAVRAAPRQRFADTLGVRRWLRAVVRCQIAQYYRSRTRELPAGLLVDVAREDADQLRALELNAELQACLARLTAEQREVVVLHMAGIPYREIGERCGVSKEAARSLHRRALAKLAAP